MVAGFVVASVALVASPAASGTTVICPPPPCLGGSQIVCPADVAIVPCGCPVALTGTTVPVPILEGCVDLSVTERVDRATATVGDRLTYTVEVRNGGPDSATDVTLADSLPGELTPIAASGPSGPCNGGGKIACALGVLGPGESATATVVARATQAGEVANTVAATTTATDLDPSNDQATATTHVAAASPPSPPPKPPSRPALRSRWCSPSGDVCFGRLRGKGPVRLGLTLAARYFKHYSLCVTAPDATTACRRFRVHRARGDTFGSTVRWNRRFPNKGKGAYQAVWSSRSGPLGPTLAFKR
jgi:uncharacterized repeat protein (TIGR01451 family)